SFVALFSRAIIHFPGAGASVFQVFPNPFSKQPFKNPLSYFPLPSISYVKPFHIPFIPNPFFLINILITSIYTIPLLSALYPPLLPPNPTTTPVIAS
ncbi:lipid II flippase family protein, partial [Bacillus subtilis]|uniref:lipid II flippase family protein n=1 Tax=Bacillus subtilis TaxID=1423 RepID=UPI00119E3171